MKPKKLVISAFGPYAGESTIDFEKLGEHGLYLITGKGPVHQLAAGYPAPAERRRTLNV